jgi:thiopurine S-methyltransferase
VQPEFWQDRWRSGQTGFHQTRVEPWLERFWPALGIPAHGTVFVPLCGKSLDLIWLRDRGHHVVGVELSRLAVEQFLATHDIAATRRSRGGIEIFESERLVLYCGDLFALQPDDLCGACGIYDRASLIAWPPPLRGRYAQAMTRLTDSGAHTLLLALEYDQTEMSGPPFSVSAQVVHDLYTPHHLIEEVKRADILDHEPRLASKGLTGLQQVCYRLERTAA